MTVSIRSRITTVSTLIICLLPPFPPRRAKGAPLRKGKPPGFPESPSPWCGERCSPHHRRTSFEQKNVAPDAVELAEALVHTNEAEAADHVQPHARLVLREDPGPQRPESRRLGTRDELFEQGASDSAPACPRGDVDAVLGNAAVAAPARDRRQRRPPGDRAVELR